MFGGGIVWFYRVLAGMNADPEKPGYRHIIFRPQPAADLTYASYSYITPYGPASIEWKKEPESFKVEIKVPVSSTSTVYIPASQAAKILENGKKIKNSPQLNFLRMEGKYAVIQTGSGNYSFTSN
jgi:alpha-L-rhamnosidase